ncbi:MAG: tetratricopeptide repeat protein [Chloroflexales bacterium]|nr:tetratricopeptide repeat protein [Chloroflexales bacterium]
MFPNPASPSPLHAYLDADQIAQLAQGQALSPTVRADLAAKLRQTLAAYAAYIPARLVQAQLADPSPGRVSGAFWQGSLLFADLSGFTALSDRLSVLGKQGAEEVSAIVNQLFNDLVAEVSNYQGALLKFGGDALTAFFDAEVLGTMHAAAATSAALAMQQRMSSFSAVETRAGTFRLGLRVGVHSGQVFAAEVGDASHIELVVTGPEVNQVALAQEIATPGEVVVTDQTVAFLDRVSIERRSAGFWQIIAMPNAELPFAKQHSIDSDGPDDLATLERLVTQVEALRPYLVRGLPRRFLDPKTAELGEFRPVSVLFANFSDFSAILAQLGDDATTAAAVLNAYFRRAQAVVHRYGGIVNKVDMYTHGDKLMALFGAPLAHEDDPLRAVRCALELEHALLEANEEIAAFIESRARSETTDDETAPTEAPLPQFQQRIGINTGAVFAGRVGGALCYEYTVMGPAVNLAARLMSVAEEDTILLSPATNAAVAHQVAIEELPAVELKGLSRPIAPARVLYVFDVERDSASTLKGSLKRVRLVGRDAEMEQLMAGAMAALRGSGGVLVLLGDAGVGKSRLVEELLQRLVMASMLGYQSQIVPSFQIYTGDCQSYEQHIPYAVIRRPLHQLLGIDLRQTPHQTRRKRGTHPLDSSVLSEALQQRVAQLASNLERFWPLLGDVLGLELSETSLTQALTPEQRHDRLQELVIALLHGAAMREPALLTLDSIHWADAASLELLDRIAKAIPAAPILLILSYRSDPPIPEPWAALPYAQRLVVRELSSEESANLLTALLDGEPPQAITPLLERSQGNPFFIEELVRTLVLTGALARGEGGEWTLTRPLEQAAVPDSIEGLLLARIDRLDEPNHELVQAASVIGRRFQQSVVQGIYTNSALLDQSLGLLVDAEIIRPEVQERDLAYLFRHALLRDVAYEGILYARRRELHRRVAQRIEELYGRTEIIAGEHLALLAWHYLRAEAWRPAFRYHIAAGIQAQQRYANRDALALFGAALAIAPRLAISEDAAWLVGQVAELHERVGDLRVLLGEYDEAEQAYQESLALVKELRVDRNNWKRSADELAAFSAQLATRRVRLHRLLAVVAERRSNYDAAFDWLERGMARATGPTRNELTRCYLLGAGIYQRRGEYTRSLEWARMGLALAERMGNTADQAHALSLMGNLWRDQGEFGSSIPALEQARALFQRLNDATQLGNVLNNLGMVYTQLGRWDDTIKCFEQSLQISENIGDILAMARTSNNLAVVLVGRGELQRAAELYRYSSEQFGRIQSVLGVALTDYNHGEVLLLQGQPQEALPLFEASITTFERIKSRNFLPEVLRLATEATLALGDTNQAQSYAAQSLAVADELGMAVESAVARRVMGQVALKTQDFAAAAEHLEQSRAALEQLDNRYELGKVLFWQAQLAHISRQIEAALPVLRQAETIFVELDAQRDLALVREMMAGIACS